MNRARISKFNARDIWPGTVFDTPFEKGCTATDGKVDNGYFAASAPDGVLCTYGLEMVTEITSQPEREPGE